jgi:putative intracellular protease/amidase
LDVTVATAGGRTPVGDELSLSLGYNNDDPDEVAFQRAYPAEHEELLASTLPLEEAQASDYDVLFVPGGHGPMQDLAVDPSIGPLMVEMLDDPDEDRLRRAGARFSSVPAWGVHVVVDGNLVTGQNWESAVPAAEAILKQLKVAA